jgi:transcriptional regulator with XRE-family HTH domain
VVQVFCLLPPKKFAYTAVMLTPATCRAARGLLGVTQRELADAARVGLTTVQAFETGSSTPVTNNLTAIQRALEVRGAQFIVGGVKFKSAPPNRI